MVILEIERSFRGFDALLGEHLWSEFLRSPTKEEMGRVSRIFWCFHSWSAQPRDHCRVFSTVHRRRAGRQRLGYVHFHRREIQVRQGTHRELGEGNRRPARLRRPCLVRARALSLPVLCARPAQPSPEYERPPPVPPQ
jgi:hypothetical protein